MPPTAGTRTSTRQGRATVRPTNYYARSFAGRLAAHGLEQTPEASNSAPGFFPALTHFTGAVDAFPKEVIKHFSMFKEVEAKLHERSAARNRTERRCGSPECKCKVQRLDGFETPN